MFRIDKDENSIKPLKARGFSELGSKSASICRSGLQSTHPACAKIC
ncbi:hypothetical protein [Yoonia vestfoldensis]|nr:hypothetical protein [Yoonia vestfoldensis]